LENQNILSDNLHSGENLPQNNYSKLLDKLRTILLIHYYFGLPAFWLAARLAAKLLGAPIEVQ
jgi:hypothetical protein